MKKRDLILTLTILSLVFSISGVFALQVSSKATDDVIVMDFPGQPAKFNVNLDVSSGESGTYNIYTLTDLTLFPEDNFQLNSGKSSMEVLVYPWESLKYRGYFTFVYNFRNENAKINQPEQMTVRVVDLKDMVEISSDSNEFGKDTLTFYIDNLEKKALNDVNVRFVSKFFDVEKTIDIKAAGKTEITLPVDKEQLRKSTAGSYLVTGFFKTEKNETVGVEGKIYIGEKAGIETSEENKGLIIRTKIVTKQNVGNVPQKVSVKVKKDMLSRLFVSFNTEPDLTERQGAMVTYTWNRQLNPADKLIVKVKTNYILPLIVLIFAAVVVYLVRRIIAKRADVVKSVYPVKAKGGEFALKVTIKVKAKKAMANVSLVDKIPAMVKLYEKSGLNASKIDYPNRRLQWDIGDLNAGESREVSYIVYSKIGVVGKFSLPLALVVFEQDGQVHEVESNNVFFLSEQVKTDRYE